MLRSHAMTVGQLARRTGVPIKALRTYEDLGFLSTLGRSQSNYRLFGEEAVRCVQMVQGLRSLGLTLKAIRALAKAHCEGPGELVEGLPQEHLPQALARVEAQISTLQALRQRILEFQAASAGAPARPAASALVQLLAVDPRCDAEPLPLDSPSGGNVYTFCVASPGRLGQHSMQDQRPRTGRNPSPSLPSEGEKSNRPTGFRHTTIG